MSRITRELLIFTDTTVSITTKAAAVAAFTMHSLDPETPATTACAIVLIFYDVTK